MLLSKHIKYDDDDDDELRSVPQQNVHYFSAFRRLRNVLRTL